MPKNGLISYHGAGKHNGMIIAEEGLKHSNSERFPCGKCIYSTPQLDVAKLYANKFEYEGQQYFVLFQNRVNPKFLEVISKRKTQTETY
jgi:hypothetical protein